MASFLCVKPHALPFLHESRIAEQGELTYSRCLGALELQIVAGAADEAPDAGQDNTPERIAHGCVLATSSQRGWLSPPRSKLSHIRCAAMIATTSARATESPALDFYPSSSRPTSPKP